MIMKVAYAVTVAEGWKPKNYGNNGAQGSTSYTNHNPGNLRSSEYEISNDGEFAAFDNDMTGFTALVRQLELAADGKSELYGDNLTIDQMFAKYTGLDSGSTPLNNYLAIIEGITGLDRNMPMGEILS